MHIAFNVREKGRGGGDVPRPGRFKEVAGIGWFVDEYNMSQISVNCTDYEVTNIHTVYESCKDDAIRCARWQRSEGSGASQRKQRSSGWARERFDVPPSCERSGRRARCAPY